MLRSLVRLSIVLTMSVGMFSCSRSDNTPTNPAAGVQGTWKLTNLQALPAIRIRAGSFGVGSFSDLYPLVQAQYPCLNAVTLTVTANTTLLNSPQGCTFTDQVVQSFLGTSFSGSYQVSGNKLTLTPTTGTATTYDLSTSGNTMTWAYQNKFPDPDFPNDPGKAIDSKVTLTFQKVP